MHRTTQFVLVGCASAVIAGSALAVAIQVRTSDGGSGSQSGITPTSASPVGSAVVIGSRADWPSLDALLAASDVIAVVTWVGDREETVGLPSADGSILDSRIDVVREFEVIEILKGVGFGTQFEASIARTNTFVPRPNIPQGATLHQEVIELNRSDTYIVFLRQQADGHLLFMGEPSLARVDSGLLRWVVSFDYVADKAEMGVPLGTDGASRPFDGQSIASLRLRLGSRP